MRPVLRWLVRDALLLLLIVTGTMGCERLPDYPSNTTVASFRILHPATGKPMGQVVVSLHDGFDRTLTALPGQLPSDHRRYHVADVTTAMDGTFDLDLARFHEQTLFFQIVSSSPGGAFYKYVDHRGDRVTVPLYRPEGHSLHLRERREYDLKTWQVVAIRYPEGQKEPPQSFFLIDVPMDSGT